MSGRKVNHILSIIRNTKQLLLKDEEKWKFEMGNTGREFFPPKRHIGKSWIRKETGDRDYRGAAARLKDQISVGYNTTIYGITPFVKAAA